MKQVYKDTQNREAGWYTLSYYYLGENNISMRDALIDPDTGSAEFNIQRMTGFSSDDSDPIQQRILHDYEKTYYLTHAYTPNTETRLYLLNACNTLININAINCAQYRDMLLEYLIAEINLENGETGACVSVSADSCNSSLGSVSGAGEFSFGDTVTLKAIPYQNVSFTGWTDTFTGETISTNTEYSFAAYNAVSVQAQFTGGLLKTAQTPIITSQPYRAQYYAGESATDLSVTAISPDDGSISVKWYVDSTNSKSEGSYVGNGLSFTPPTLKQGKNTTTQL